MSGCQLSRKGRIYSSMRRYRDHSGYDLPAVGHANPSQSRPDRHRRDLQMLEENARISRAKGASE
jgi:hypothetical protein